MKDYMTLGPTPSAEECIGVGDPLYHTAGREEVKRFRQMLEAMYPEPPYGAYFAVKSFPHDFGTYRDVCVIFDDDDEEATAFAYHLEANTPETWADTTPVPFVVA